MPNSPLRVIEEQLGKAVRAPKCYRCGCLHKTVDSLAKTESGLKELAPVLSQARSVFVDKEYDCLGCPECYPAIAANAFAEMHPEVASGLDLCPTDLPPERAGWPPLPGDYFVMRYHAPVAVCTLNSSGLAAELRDLAPLGLSIVGTMHTENLGIERLIRNTVANPNVRFLILCGEDGRQRIGHLPGQSLASLFANGLDDRSRIIGAQGKRPFLKNATREEVAAFCSAVELVNLTGEERTSRIALEIERCASRNPGASEKSAFKLPIKFDFVDEPKPLVLDPAGYLVLYTEPRRRSLVLEHYGKDGVLDTILEGRTAGALYQGAIARGLVSRLDHAAYLGQELARAEESLLTCSTYVQDKAPEPPPRQQMSTSSCDYKGSCE